MIYKQLFRKMRFICCDPRSQRGSLLVTTLCILFILAAFSVITNRRASQELLMARWLKEGVMLRSYAHAGIERGVFEVRSQDSFPVFDAYSESWASNEAAFREVPIGVGSFSVVCDPYLKIGAEEEETSSSKATGDEKLRSLALKPRWGLCDESSRINLNTADEPMLVSLIQAVMDKIPLEEAGKIAQSIIDWRDSDDAAMSSGAESSFYGFLSPSYKARNKAFESVEELTMIRGVTPFIYQKLKPFVTVYTDEKVNLNTASEPVLQALGLSADTALKLVVFRAGVDGKIGTEDDRVFQHKDEILPLLNAEGNSVFSAADLAQISNLVQEAKIRVKSRVFRIQSIGRLIRNGRSFEQMITCVIKRNGDILYWHEGN